MSQLTGALDSEDTRVMVECLQQLGARIEWERANCVARVQGTGGRLRNGELSLYVENSGTTMRFLTSLCCLGSGAYRLDGNARMRERPIGDLMHGLRSLGVRCDSELANDCPPVLVMAHGLPGGDADVAGDISSQFLSGLLLSAPYAQTAVRLRVTGKLVSRPYVEMTIRVMRSFGVEVAEEALQRFQISGGHYRATNYAIEPDASAASYFWGGAAITGGSVLVKGLNWQSLQGDVRFCDCLRRMGCRVEDSATGLHVHGRPLHGIDVDMSDISDTVPTLAVVALFAQGPTTIRGVAHVRHKESDRIADLARELRKLGAGVDEFPDGLRIVPQPLRAATLATYDDHRMAMALSLVGLMVSGIVIEGPSCVAKTYPEFFADLRRLASS
jgi:3-phosphoshikimate 1-carboxyvinyltransferase